MSSPNYFSYFTLRQARYSCATNIIYIFSWITIFCFGVQSSKSPLRCILNSLNVIPMTIESMFASLGSSQPPAFADSTSAMTSGFSGHRVIFPHFSFFKCPHLWPPLNVRTFSMAPIPVIQVRRGCGRRSKVQDMLMLIKKGKWLEVGNTSLKNLYKSYRNYELQIYETLFLFLI